MSLPIALSWTIKRGPDVPFWQLTFWRDGKLVEKLSDFITADAAREKLVELISQARAEPEVSQGSHLRID